MSKMKFSNDNCKLVARWNNDAHEKTVIMHSKIVACCFKNRTWSRIRKEMCPTFEQFFCLGHSHLIRIWCMLLQPSFIEGFSQGHSKMHAHFTPKDSNDKIGRKSWNDRACVLMKDNGNTRAFKTIGDEDSFLELFFFSWGPNVQRWHLLWQTLHWQDGKFWERKTSLHCLRNFKMLIWIPGKKSSRKWHYTMQCDYAIGKMGFALDCWDHDHTFASLATASKTDRKMSIFLLQENHLKASHCTEMPRCFVDKQLDNLTPRQIWVQG